jgi:hypothetical protein
LKKMSQDLPNVDYEEIIKILRESIRRIPIPLAILHAHTAIDRARKNIGEALFTDVHNQLSYIRDPDVITNYLTEFGRANKPHQALFYGATSSTLVDTPRITAIAETSALFQDRNGVNLKGELYTVSRWRNNVPLMLLEVVFSQQALAVNPDIRRNYNNQLQMAAKAGYADMGFYEDLLIFFSEEFARPKDTHHDYKISTAYTELAFKHPDVQGIAFPSVQTDYYGQNVVFPPSVVDQYLEVDVLTVQRLHKNKDRMKLNNFKNCENPQDCLSNIVWTDLDPNYIESDDSIQDFLAGKV